MSPANKLLAAAVKVVKKLDSLPTLPYYTSTFQWDKAKSTLFYKGESTSGFLNFPATNSQLESLFNACSAGKLDPGSFGMSFSPWQEGLVGVVEGGLLKDVESKKIQVELSRLNVYGPGGSPVTADAVVPPSMIASLIVILPTVHEGGSLILRQDGEKWTFDTSTAVSTTPTAQAAFVASYSNIKHEVQKITSGYLVTLTYNFYLKKDIKTSPALSPELQQHEPKLKASLDHLLKDPAFFPDGGFIGFGLSHKYPFVLGSTKLSDIKENLKGSDETIKRACEGVSLETSIKGVYIDDDDELPGRGVLLDNPTNYNYQVQGSLIDHLADWGDPVLDHKKYGTEDYDLADEPIAWLRPLRETNPFTFFYVDDDYKRPSANDVDAEICLVAKIPSAQERGLPTAPDTQTGSEPDSDCHENKKRRLSTDM